MMLTHTPGREGRNPITQNRPAVRGSQSPREWRIRNPSLNISKLQKGSVIKIFQDW